MRFNCFSVLSHSQAIQLQLDRDDSGVRLRRLQHVADDVSCERSVGNNFPKAAKSARSNSHIANVHIKAST